MRNDNYTHLVVQLFTWDSFFSGGGEAGAFFISSVPFVNLTLLLRLRSLPVGTHTRCHIAPLLPPSHYGICLRLLSREELRTSSPRRLSSNCACIYAARPSQQLIIRSYEFLHTNSKPHHSSGVELNDQRHENTALEGYRYTTPLPLKLLLGGASHYSYRFPAARRTCCCRLFA